MTRKNQKSVSFYLSTEEKKALDKIRGKMTYREYVLRGVVNPRKIGRPSLDAATKDLEAQYKQHAEDQKKSVHDQLLKANKKGLDPEVSIRMLGDESPWKKIRCRNCGKVYYTQFKTSSKCPSCSVLNKTTRPPIEIPTGEPTILNKFEFGPDPSVEAATKGNLSEGYTPAEWPGMNRTGGVASNPKPSVIGWDESRFKYGKKKKAEG